MVAFVVNLVSSGHEALRQFVLLNNRMQVVTKDSANNVALWDIVKAEKLKDYGKISLEEKVAHAYDVEYCFNFLPIASHTHRYRN